MSQLSDKTLSYNAEKLPYWHDQLHGLPPLLELPLDRNRPMQQGFTNSSYSFEFPQPLYTSLRQSCNQGSGNMFIDLLAAFQILLARYSQQDDIAVGTPVVNNSVLGEEQYLNIVVLRNDLSGKPDFLEVARRLRKVVHETIPYQDVPFEQVLEAVQAEHTAVYHPLVQVLFIFHPSPFALHTPQEPIQRLFDKDALLAKMDLVLEMAEEAGGVHCRITYNADLFESATITRMAGCLQVLLKSIAAHPSQSITELPLLIESEYRQILFEWNQTQSDYPKELCVHQMYEQQVVHTPDAIAVVGENERLTYAELNQRANQVAYYLREQGVGPEILVGICMERSVEAIVGLLGILKAGGAYLPLDPAYPDMRLTYMINDANLTIVLTSTQLKMRLAELSYHPVRTMSIVCLDEDQNSIGTQPVTNPENTTCVSNLAYVIYTSGSTGYPKGVSVMHRSVNNIVFSEKELPIGPSHCVAQTSGISFDIATWEIWESLLQGAKLVLVSKDMLLSPQKLTDCIHKEAINVLFLTSSVFRLFAHTAPYIFASIEYLIFGGEAADLSATRIARTYVEHVMNAYGPTEATAWSNWYIVQDLPESARSVPIGRPLANTQCYVLDAELQPVPIGVPGELYIGGDGLARGYLNRPDLTAERFLPNPFSSEPGARIYKTGDLVRYLAHGNIEFIGRRDHQVKLRGFRIELGEIEAALNQHADIRESLVLFGHDEVRGDYLIAYLLPRDGNVPSKKELSPFLAARLPEYMIPLFFLIVEQWPLTPNGKVDHQALPKPAWSQVEQQETMVLPRTPLERHVAQLWSEVLRVQQIGVHQNFFDLGGYSLLAWQLIVRIQTVYKVTLTLRTFFDAPTIADLSARIEQSKEHGSTQPRHDVVPLARDAYRVKRFSGKPSFHNKGDQA